MPLTILEKPIEFQQDRRLNIKLLGGWHSSIIFESQFLKAELLNLAKQYSKSMHTLYVVEELAKAYDPEVLVKASALSLPFQSNRNSLGCSQSKCR